MPADLAISTNGASCSWLRWSHPGAGHAERIGMPRTGSASDRESGGDAGSITLRPSPSNPDRPGGGRACVNDCHDRHVVNVDRMVGRFLGPAPAPGQESLAGSEQAQTRLDPLLRAPATRPRTARTTRRTRRRRQRPGHYEARSAPCSPRAAARVPERGRSTTRGPVLRPIGGAVGHSGADLAPRGWSHRIDGEGQSERTVFGGAALLAGVAERDRQVHPTAPRRSGSSPLSNARRGARPRRWQGPRDGSHTGPGASGIRRARARRRESTTDSSTHRLERGPRPESGNRPEGRAAPTGIVPSGGVVQLKGREGRGDLVPPRPLATAAASSTAAATASSGPSDRCQVASTFLGTPAPLGQTEMRVATLRRRRSIDDQRPTRGWAKSSASPRMEMIRLRSILEGARAVDVSCAAAMSPYRRRVRQRSHDEHIAGSRRQGRRRSPITCRSASGTRVPESTMRQSPQG